MLSVVVAGLGDGGRGVALKELDLRKRTNQVEEGDTIIWSDMQPPFLAQASAKSSSLIKFFLREHIPRVSHLAGAADNAASSFARSAFLISLRHA